MLPHKNYQIVLARMAFANERSPALPAKSSAKPVAKKQTAKVMDVAKPGKTAPTATSRPVIVGHRMLQDPMMSDKKSDDAAKPDEAEKVTPARVGGKVIAPLEPTPDDKPAEKTPVTEATEPTEPPKPEDEPEPATEENPAEVEEAPAEEKSKSTDEDAGVVDALAEQAGSKKKQPEASEEENKKQEELDKLIADKKYFVKTGQVTHRRHTRWAAVFLVLIILIGGAVLAVDAELLDVGVNLPFDLIKV